MKLLNLLIATLIMACTASSQQPAEINVFNAERLNHGVLLTWTPSIEPETNYFEIQRSSDAENWKVIALMFPFEDATQEHSYKYYDKTATGSSTYYRIRQLDMHKNENFSKAKLIASMVADK